MGWAGLGWLGAPSGQVRRRSARAWVRALNPHQAFLTIQAIASGSQSTTLTDAEQAAATVAMVGAIALNGFMGRKKEWEILTLAHMQDQLIDGFDYVVCSEHKTSYVYGEVAKWLAPGTVEAAKAYLRLPRRAGVDTFLCPAKKGTAHVDVPSALRTFCHRYVGQGFTFPTINLLRKWYHNAIRGIAADDARLHKLFAVVDAHGAGVQDKYYRFRTPAADVKLAKHLVECLLGNTVPWPGPSELVGKVKEEVLALMQVEHGAGADLGAGDDEEEELEYFEFGEYFGIFPLRAIAGAPACAPAAIEGAPHGGMAGEGANEADGATGKLGTGNNRGTRALAAHLWKGCKGPKGKKSKPKKRPASAQPQEPPQRQTKGRWRRGCLITSS